MNVTDDAITGEPGRYGDHVSLHELIVVENVSFRGIYTKGGGVVAEIKLDRNQQGLVQHIHGLCEISAKASDFQN